MPKYGTAPPSTVEMQHLPFRYTAALVAGGSIAGGLMGLATDEVSGDTTLGSLAAMALLATTITATVSIGDRLLYRWYQSRQPWLAFPYKMGWAAEVTINAVTSLIGGTLGFWMDYETDNPVVAATAAAGTAGFLNGLTRYFLHRRDRHELVLTQVPHDFPPQGGERTRLGP